MPTWPGAGGSYALFLPRLDKRGQFGRTARPRLGWAAAASPRRYGWPNDRNVRFPIHGGIHNVLFRKRLRWADIHLLGVADDDVAAGRVGPFDAETPKLSARGGRRHE